MKKIVAYLRVNLEEEKSEEKLAELQAFLDDNGIEVDEFSSLGSEGIWGVNGFVAYVVDLRCCLFWLRSVYKRLHSVTV